MSSLFAEYVEGVTPRTNELLMEGLSYNMCKHTENYMDNFIRYNVQNSQTHLTYVGCKKATPQEEFQFLVGKKAKKVFDISPSDVYMMKYYFEYNGVPLPETVVFLPHIRRGNLMFISGARYLVSPVLADKVISVGNNIIFVDVLTAKYNFEYLNFNICVNGEIEGVYVVFAIIYRNAVSKGKPISTAKPITLHYLLAYYGYHETMKRLLGFVPELVDITQLDKRDISEYVIVESTGNKPRSYIDKFNEFRKSNLVMLVPKDKWNIQVKDIAGSFFYIVDNFVTKVDITTYENADSYKIILGQLIKASGDELIGMIRNTIKTHFNSIEKRFNPEIISKLETTGYQIHNVFDMMELIILNMRNWTLQVPDASYIYNNKTYETQLFYLKPVISQFVKFILALSKDELKMPDRLLSIEEVKKVLNSNVSPKRIFNIRKQDNKAAAFVTSVENVTDNIYNNMTATVVEQESNPVSSQSSKTTRGKGSSAKKLHATAITVGCMLNIPKKKTTPIVRLNPYVNTELSHSGMSVNVVVSPHIDIINRTQFYLSNNFGSMENEVVDEVLNCNLLADDDTSDLEIDDEVNDEDSYEGGDEE